MSDERTIKPNAPADFTPQLGDYKTLQPFRYWCQKVLPLVYDDSLSYYELLCKVVDYLNKTMEDVETLHVDVTSLHTAYEELQSYVNNYFSSLDVQQEINNKLDQMSSDGTLLAIMIPTITNTTNEWLSANITNPSNPPLDKSLTIANSAAEAKATGTLCMRYKSTLTGDVSSAEVGTYTVDKNTNTGLPDNMVEQYGWLICFSVNAEYMLIEDGSAIRIWVGKPNSWKSITDTTLTLSNVPADSKTTGSLCMRYKGALNGAVSNAEVGTYAVDKNTNTGLPDSMVAQYGWLICFSVNKLYILIESVGYPTLWIREGVNWFKLNNSLENKKIAFIGDSITEYNQTATSNYVTYLQTISKVIVQNLGLSGSGFARYYDTNRNYINRLSNINQDTELLCVSGSFNDLESGLPLGESTDVGGTQTVCGYINQFFDKAETDYPTLKICCYTLNYWNFSNLTPALNYINALKTICSRRAIPFKNVTEMCNIRPWISGNSNAYIYNNDGTHPNSKGHALIYPIIRDFIESIMF